MLFARVCKYRDDIEKKELANEENSEEIKQLAMLLSMTGEQEEALQLLERQVETYSSPHASDIQLANALQNLAIAYRISGKYEEAIKLLSRALILQENALGKENEIVGETLNSLSIVYYCQGNVLQAETALDRALNIFHSSTQSHDETIDDIPWEEYKEIRKRKENSIAQNSLTLLKENIRIEAKNLINARKEKINRKSKENSKTIQIQSSLRKSLSDSCILSKYVET